MTEVTLFPLDVVFGKVRIIRMLPRNNPDGSMTFRSRFIETGYEGRVIRDEIVDGVTVRYE